jgi:hypothetical protein
MYQVKQLQIFSYKVTEVNSAIVLYSQGRNSSTPNRNITLALDIEICLEYIRADGSNTERVLKISSSELSKLGILNYKIT